MEAFAIRIEEVMLNALNKEALGTSQQQDKYLVERGLRPHGMEYKQDRVYEQNGDQALNPAGQRVPRWAYRWP